MIGLRQWLSGDERREEGSVCGRDRKDTISQRADEGGGTLS